MSFANSGAWYILTAGGVYVKLEVTRSAMTCFKEEWGFKPGDFGRIFIRYGGCSTVQSSFSLGIAKEEPREIGLSTTQDGITFYMEKDDVWYMDGKDLIIDFDKDVDEIVFQYT